MHRIYPIHHSKTTEPFRASKNIARSGSKCDCQVDVEMLKGDFFLHGRSGVSDFKVVHVVSDLIIFSLIDHYFLALAFCSPTLGRNNQIDRLVCLFVYLCLLMFLVCLLMFVCLFVCLVGCLVFCFVLFCLFVCLSACLFVCLLVCLFVCFCFCVFNVCLCVFIFVSVCFCLFLFVSVCFCIFAQKLNSSKFI